MLNLGSIYPGRIRMMFKTPYPGPGVDLGAVPEKDPDDVGLISAGRQMERRLPAHSRLVRARLQPDARL